MLPLCMNVCSILHTLQFSLNQERQLLKGLWEFFFPVFSSHPSAPHYQIITAWEAALNRDRGGYEPVIKLTLDIFISH